jgi:hypothetical protein
VKGNGRSSIYINKRLQGYFALIEQVARDAIRDGATVEALSDLYLDNLR